MATGRRRPAAATGGVRHALAVITVLAVGAVVSLVLHDVLTTRADRAMAGEFEDRAATALASVDRDLSRYAELVNIMASFTGATDPPTPDEFQRFAEDSGILRFSSNRALGYVEFVAPSELTDVVTREAALGNDTFTPLTLPDRLAGADDLYLLMRTATSTGTYDFFEVDGGLLDSLRLAIDEVRVSRVATSFDFRDSLSDLDSLIAELATQGIDLGGVSNELAELMDLTPEDVQGELGYGLVVPVFAEPGGPVTGVILAGTLPLEGVAAIDESTGSDLDVSLAVQYAGDDLLYFHGHAPETSMVRSGTGEIGGIDWVVEASASPSFADGFDDSAAKTATGAALTATLLVACLLVIRRRHELRAVAAWKRTAEAEQRAERDALTGLYNRVGLDVALARLGIDGPTSLAICFLDLDGLKEVNDTLGHDAGDRLLVETASRLRRQVRGGDVVARIGGDEFVVMLPGVEDIEAACHVAKGLLERLREPFGEFPGGIGVSVGVAISRDGHARSAAVALADAAMYRAKSAGGNRVVADRAGGRHVSGNSSVSLGAEVR